MMRITDNSRMLSMLLATIGLCVTLIGCGNAMPNIPTTRDQPAQDLVERLGRETLTVSENAEKAHFYDFRLAELSPKGIAGMSVGNHVIYIDHDLASRATYSEESRQMLHMIIAHEIGHDAANHVANSRAVAGGVSAGQLAGQGLSYVPGPIGLIGGIASLLFAGIGRVGMELYSRSQELEADRKGIEYWRRLGRDCNVWIQRFQSMADQGAKGDLRHPTEGRLDQARELCRSQSPISIPLAKPVAEPPTTSAAEPPAGKQTIWKDKIESFADPSQSSNIEPILHPSADQDMFRKYGIEPPNASGRPLAIKGKR